MVGCQEAQIRFGAFLVFQEFLLETPLSTLVMHP